MRQSMYSSITLRKLDNIDDLRKIMINHAKEEGWLYSEDDVQYEYLWADNPSG